MKYFLDTEFIEDGRTIDLVSIGIVAEDDRELYFCNTDAQLNKANDWVRENVLPKLPSYGKTEIWKPKTEIRRCVESFFRIYRTALGSERVIDASPIEIWTEYGSYDWVVFCQLWGPMVKLPESFPRFTYDLMQLSSMKSPNGPEPINASPHNSLEDARWARMFYDELMSREWIYK